jgi:hypothetical protein
MCYQNRGFSKEDKKEEGRKKRRAMRVRKFIYLLTFVFAMFAATSNSNAAAFAWTGLGDGTSWDDPFNWDQLAVPPHDSGDVGLHDTTNGNLITIDADVAADCTYGNDYGTIFGPEFGMNLDIYGSLTYKWSMATFANDPLSPTVVNMFDGSSIGAPDQRPEDVAIGNVWWDHTGPYVTMNMYGDSAVYVNWFWFGGHLNMYGGTLDIVNTFAMDGNNDALTLVDMYEGTIILQGDSEAFINDLINRGVLIAYGGAGEIVIDNEVNPGRTTVTGIIPEPATIALMCLGSLALIRKKRS